MLQESGEVLMAEPFSAVPTLFTVEVGNQRWWGNCIWDALGIPAMLKQDAHIITSCGCCNEAMTLEVRDDRLQQPDAGVVHFALPPRMWWNDVVFAWKTILLFRSEELVERWCRQWHQPRGAIIELAQQWRLAQAWYEDRLTFDWRRKTTEEVDALWHELSFTTSFWSLA